MDAISTKNYTKYDIEVAVLGTIKGGGYRLKVSLLGDLGMFMAGWTLRPPKNNGSWWLQPPAQRVGDRWINIPEFSHDTMLWEEISQKCLEAAKQFEETADSSPSDSDLSDEAIAKSLDNAFASRHSIKEVNLEY